MNLKELAARLGLSPTTVSRALNGYPEVSEQTRQRVRQAAMRHDYHPNSRAKQLATGRAMAIGHVIPMASQHEVVNPVFADFIAGAGEVYSRMGYDMVLSVVSDGEEAAAYRAMKAKGNVDGVIVHGPKSDDGRIALLREIDLPFVVHGRASLCRLPYAWVDVNNRRAFATATEVLLGLGHQRIALLNGLEVMDFALRRRAGYLEAHQARGLSPDPALMAQAEMTEASGYRAGGRMLDLPDPPSAFLVSSMISAIGLRRAIEARGLKLGRDISVIIHDDDLSYLKNGEETPIFTAMRSSVRLAGGLAAAHLLSMIAEPPEVLPHRLLEAELIFGQSTPAAAPFRALGALHVGGA